MAIDHFFDDFYYVVRDQESSVTTFCLREAFKLLGFALDADKSQVPAEVAEVLGVCFNMQSLSSQKILMIQPRATRVVNLGVIIDSILQADAMPHAGAASLLGKFGFLCSTMFGKVGRSCTGPLRDYLKGEPASPLPPHVVMTLKLMKILVHVAKPRKCFVHDTRSPILLYTDASDVPERGCNRWIVGAVLIHNENLRYTHYIVPQTIIDRWLPKETHMGQLELLACPLALATWHDLLRSAAVLHFVDNDSAAAGLVRGFSPKRDSSAIIGDYWILAATHEIDIYIDRVESKSNISDGPSRLDFTLLETLKGHWTPPRIDFLAANSFSV